MNDIVMKKKLILSVGVTFVIMACSTLFCREIFWVNAPIMLITGLALIYILNAYDIKVHKSRLMRFFISLLLLVQIEYFALVISTIFPLSQWCKFFSLDIFVVILVFMLIYVLHRRYLVRKNNAVLDFKKERKNLLIMLIFSILGLTLPHFTRTYGLLDWL